MIDLLIRQMFKKSKLTKIFPCQTFLLYSSTSFGLLIVNQAHNNIYGKILQREYWQTW